MKKCKKCILPESYPGISFNDEGICNFCLEYQPFHRYIGKDKLLEVLTSKAKTGQYDCVVPISGGKDSTYILYYIVKELGLNPIAVSYDSGFQVDISKENAKNACNILGVPLIIVKSPGNISSRLLKESLLASEKVGWFWHQCMNCEAIIRTVSINTAKTYKVPFVIWGSSALESVDNKNYENYKSLGKRRKVIPNTFLYYLTSKFMVLLKNPKKANKIPGHIYSFMGYHVVKFNFLSILQRLRLNFPYRYSFKPHAIPPFSIKNPRFVHFFDYIPWDSIKNVKLLKDELNWKHPIENDSRFDCLIHCLVNYQFLKDHGISLDGANLCNFVRESVMDREDAMNREIHIVNSIEIGCKALINRFGIKNYRMP